MEDTLQVIASYPHIIIYHLPIDYHHLDGTVQMFQN